MKLTTRLEFTRILNLGSIACLVGLLAVFLPEFTQAQNPVVGTPESNQIFVARCGGCHGADARGSDRGPALADVRRLRTRSVQQLRDIIQKGIPGTGMPPFDLPAAELDALAVLVRSLNGPAAEGMVSGDPAAGEKYFFSQGQCASCHMVYGKGQPVGPDLSNVGAEMTVGQIREALFQPSVRITPGYELVTVELRNGRSVRGFARSRSNFDVRLQALDGKFHLMHEDEIAAIRGETQSFMPPTKANPEELQGLLAYLSRLTGVKPGPSAMAQSPPPDGLKFSRILNPKPGEWLTYNGKLNGNRYSELKSINTTNVKNLVVKWSFSVPLWRQLLPDTPYYAMNMR
jgi:putative heme-binding domain-containing protein